MNPIELAQKILAVVAGRDEDMTDAAFSIAANLRHYEKWKAISASQAPQSASGSAGENSALSQSPSGNQLPAA